jgi:hypothetical protein
MKRRFSFTRTTNCWLFVAALLVCGRLRGLVLVWDSPVPHAMGITWKGNVVHFRRTRGEPRVCSLWLTGTPELFRPWAMAEIPWRRTRLAL